MAKLLADEPSEICTCPPLPGGNFRLLHRIYCPQNVAGWLPMKEAIDKAMQAGGEQVTQDEIPVEASEGLPPKWSDTEDSRRELQEKLKDFGPNVAETDRPRMPATDDFGGAGTLPDGAFEEKYGRPRTTIVRPGSGYQPQPGEKVVEVPEEMAQRLVDEASDETTIGEIRKRAADIVEAMKGGTVVSSGQLAALGMSRQGVWQRASEIVKATTKYGSTEVAMLGLATTKQLLEEIAARGRTEPYYGELGAEMEMGVANLIEKLPGSMLDYRTARDSDEERRISGMREGELTDRGQGCWPGCKEGHTYGLGCVLRADRKRRPGRTIAQDPAVMNEIKKVLTKPGPLVDEAAEYAWNKRKANPLDKTGVPYSCEQAGERHAWAHLVRGGEPISIPQCQLCHAYDWEDIRRQAVEYARKYAARLLEETYGYFEYPDGSRSMKWVDGKHPQINIQQIYNLFWVSETVNLFALPDLGGEPLPVPELLDRGDTWHQTRIGKMVLEEHLHRYEQESIGWLRCRYVYGSQEVCGDAVSQRNAEGAPQNGRRIYWFSQFGVSEHPEDPNA